LVDAVALREVAADERDATPLVASPESPAISLSNYAYLHS
jgi:hypothetical protein